ncbi:MAG: flagellar hook-associated protein 3 [Planctomycetes bacterium GWF2_42_9]|nr:MAG: flagellar hook-associated protein 3 [Planctomycetes bacterium GWF2_42_9]HAL45278.1 flagellar hook-associated protein 3 [Phycisphaerales bacterium]
MGGTLDKIYNNTVYSLYLNSKSISTLQEQSSTGSRINRASDDPTSSYQVLGLQSQSRELKSYIDIIGTVSSTLTMTSTALQRIGSVLTEIKTSLTGVLSGTNSGNGDSGNILIEVVNDALEELVSKANSQNAGKYLFGGSDTNNKPYAVQYDSEKGITSVNYTGSQTKLTVEVAPGVSTTSYQIGEEYFSCDQPQTPVFFGDTGAKVGKGNASVSATVWLDVTQDADGHYNLSIGGDTVDLGSYTGDLTNVPVSDADGNVLYVDASAISKTGKNMITVPGTYDIFNILISVRDLMQDKSLSATQLQTYQNELINMIEDVYSQIVSQQTAVGSKSAFLEDLNKTIEDINYNTEDQTTLLQQADITQISIDLARRQTLYELTLSVAGKLMSMSLLDYMD